MGERKGGRGGGGRQVFVIMRWDKREFGIMVMATYKCRGQCT